MQSPLVPHLAHYAAPSAPQVFTRCTPQLNAVHLHVQVFMWINATYPHAKHSYLNSCKPATPSAVVAACLDTYIPEDVDLILIEVPCRHNFLAGHHCRCDMP